ncbi:MAG: TonB-dependent receptor [Acidobacteriota bacterium]
MKNGLKVFLITTFVLTLIALGYPQGRQTGSLMGTVVDENNQPLPGAIVMMTGTGLMGLRTYVTSETGRFHFPALSPGKYDLRVEMPGFKTVIRKDLIVKVGHTLALSVPMKISAIEEEIEVIAEFPLIDVNSSKVSLNYSSEFIASIPMNRDLYDIQNSIPGAIPDGADYRRTSSILGGTVRSSLYALDGVSMNDPATFYSVANINVDIYEEIEFGAGALPAEVGQSDSAFINIVTKSGGNNFSGGAIFYYTNDSLAKDLITQEDIVALEVDKPEKYSGYYDASLNFGGPILTDRAWFYLSGRRLAWQKDNPYRPEKRMAALGMDSSHYDHEHQEWMGFAKLTLQLTDQIKYMGMFHYNHIYEPYYTNRIGSSYSVDVVDVWNHENNYSTTHRVNWIINQNTFVEARGTYVHRYFPLNHQPGTEGEYTYYDRSESVYWGRLFYDNEDIRKKMLASASITHFADNLFGASHELKAGAEFEQSESHHDWYRENPYYSYWWNYAEGNPYYYSPSNKIGRLQINYCPPLKGIWDIQDHIRRYSGYVQNSLDTGRLTVNLGLRFDYSFQYEPQQLRPELRYNYGPPLAVSGLEANDLLEALINKWHEEIGPISPFDELTTSYKKVVEFITLSPRIGLTYDLSGDGKTAIKASFSRYYEPLWTAKYNASQIFGAGSINYYWYDLNGNMLMDLPPTDDYQLISYPLQDPDYTNYVEDLKPPYVDEFLVGIERELFRDFKLSFEFIYKINKNIIEDIDIHNGYDHTATDEEGLIWLPYTFTEPGYDGQFGTEDDQQMTVYGLRQDRPVPAWMGTNPPEAERKYWAFIMTFDKRMSKKWQLKGSVLYSSFKGNTDAGYSATEGKSVMFNNPSTLINAHGPLYFDRPFQAKLMGSFILPFDFIFSAYFQHHSGSPWTRTLERVYFPPEMNVQQAYVSVNAEPAGSRRNSPYTNLDIRLEKSFPVGQESKLNFYLDIFNVGGRKGINLYQNPAGFLWAYQSPPVYEYDSQYGDVSNIYGVRSLRLGLRFSF